MTTMKVTRTRTLFKEGDIEEEGYLGVGSIPKIESVLCLLTDLITGTKWAILWIDVLRRLPHHPWERGEHN